MSENVEEMLLTPEAESQRLWEGAQEAIQNCEHSFAHLSEAIDLGARVVEIMTAQCLQRVRHQFPGSVSILFGPPPLTIVDPWRDFVAPVKSLRFSDAIDMLSAEELPCVSPQLHHGWADHAALCKDCRAITRKATSISLDEQQRQSLALIGAYRNRIFFTAPPVRVVPDEVMRAYPALVEIVNHLFALAKAPAS